MKTTTEMDLKGLPNHKNNKNKEWIKLKSQGYGIMVMWGSRMENRAVVVPSCRLIWDWKWSKIVTWWKQRYAES